jgi:hypothetical protein
MKILLIRLLKNRHLAAVLASLLVRRSAVYAPEGTTPPRRFLR